MYRKERKKEDVQTYLLQYSNTSEKQIDLYHLDTCLKNCVCLSMAWIYVDAYI